MSPRSVMWGAGPSAPLTAAAISCNLKHLRLHPEMEPVTIQPVILAAGPSTLGFPTALAPLGVRTALEIAVANCAGLPHPIVIAGTQTLRTLVPAGARLLVNRNWRRGLISSIRLALRHVPAEAALMLYPVDLPLLTPALVRDVVRGFVERPAGKEIVMPRCGSRNGHPVILSAQVAPELRLAPTAREVVYRDPGRLLLLPVDSTAIYRDIDTPAAYRACVRDFKRAALDSNSAGHARAASAPRGPS